MRADGRQPSQDDIEKITSIFVGATKPLYVGFISLETGLPLSKVIIAVERMLDLKRIRRLTAAELESIDARGDAEVYLAVR